MSELSSTTTHSGVGPFELNPGPENLGIHGAIPTMLAPLSRAARDKQPLIVPVREITQYLGFDSMEYGFTTAKTLDRDSRIYRWGTLPDEWLNEYDRRSYVE